MNSEQWKQVKEVLYKAINMPRDARGSFVSAACSADAELLTEVESLLAAHDREQLEGHSVSSVVAVNAEAINTAAVTTLDEKERVTLAAALGAQFDVLELIGSGGMGSVYLAHEQALSRTVAIKVLPADRAASPGSRERFRREARIAAQLSHAAIVPLHSFGEVNGLWYFVMEYVRGPSLAQRIALEGRLQPDEARRILLALAEALEHAHQRGVVHRDIKPANILLDDNSGRPRLADFGISKMEGSSDSLTATGAVLGTPRYMSPEQANGQTEVDARSDIYSLGAVGYEMLIGEAPFAGNDARVMLLRRQVEVARPLLEIDDKLPADLAAVVMRCLAREREERWPDATALKVALRSSGHVRSSELPQAVADLPGFAAYAIGWMLMWTGAAFGLVSQLVNRLLLLLLAVLVPIGLGLHVWRLRTYGMRRRQVLRIMLWPPKWWGLWWPTSLRDPDDLWRLLPWIARATRIALSVFFIALPPIVFASDAMPTGSRVMRNSAAALIIAGPILITMCAVWWAIRRGLSFDRALQFLFATTAPSAFWQEREVARLLSPAGQLVRAPDIGDAADHVRAVLELIRRFPVPLATVGTVARTAAQRQSDAVAQLDRDIALLERDASYAEAERLEHRLELLAVVEVTSSEHLELGDTLRRQLELLRRMQGRHSLLLSRRAELIAHLHALWLQMGAVVAVHGDGAVAIALSEDRVKELCLKIAAQMHGR